MSAYSYVAVNEMGRRVRGTMTADNEIDLEERLKQIGLDLIDQREVKEKKRGGTFSRVRLRDMIILCLHLEQLNRAGVPLHEAIADVRDSTESAKLRDVLTSVYESIKGGEMFSKALSHHPKIFNEVFTGLIAAGEKTGDLGESYGHLSEHMKWSDEIKRKVRKATGYPVFLSLMMIVAVTVMMLYVVPPMVDFLKSQGFALPIHTRALIATSEFFSSYWYIALGLPLFIIFTIVTLYNINEDFAYKVDKVILKIPLIGPTVRKINMARFTHFFAVMFNSGIDILDSLESAKGVVGNRVLKESVDMVKKSVSEGNSLTSSLRISNQFPSLVVRMFKVGEDSGNMQEALENINFFYNREVNDAVDAVVASIQPALLIVMGGMIFWIISAVFGPLYQSFSKMKF